MACLYCKRGLIIDRSKGYKPLTYTMPDKSKSYLKQCLEAHNHIMSILTPNIRERATAKEIRAWVLLYVASPKDKRPELLLQIAMPNNMPIRQNHDHPQITLEKLIEMWINYKSDQGINPNHLKSIGFYLNRIKEFFTINKFKTTSDLKVDTALQFLKWCQSKGFSASTQKKELMALKGLAKIAYRHNCIQNGNMWDGIKIKFIAGVNMKVVEPLSIDEQIDLLNKLKHNPVRHDFALLLLITGMRIGEGAAVKPDSIKDGLLTIRGTKTASAYRTLPVCPTLVELFKRGHIFKCTSNAFKIILKRNYKGVHAHRLRHSFAVNNLLAERPLQMVSHQIGHSEIGLTADLYGKFKPEHFKAGFEEAIRLRKLHLNWLENNYFNEENSASAEVDRLK